MNKKCSRGIITIIFITLLLGVLIGFAIGSYITIKAITSITRGFIDEELIQQALFQYKNRIMNCFPAKNITI